LESPDSDFSNLWVERAAKHSLPKKRDRSSEGIIVLKISPNLPKVSGVILPVLVSDMI